MHVFYKTSFDIHSPSERQFSCGRDTYAPEMLLAERYATAIAMVFADYAGTEISAFWRPYGASLTNTQTQA